MVPSFVFYLSVLLNVTLLYYKTLSTQKSEAVKNRLKERSENFTLFEGEEIVSGWHNMRLTHIVLPFHASHLTKLEQNVKSWSQYLPCSSEDNGKAASNNNYHLVFYSSTDAKKKEKIAEIETRLTALVTSLPEAVSKCFNSWEIQHANLSSNSDTYYRGTRLMLEKMLLGKVRFGNNSIPFHGEISAEVNLGYAFYMEPDCVPVRNNWLNALDWNSRWPNQIFWIKGSIYRGGNKGPYATRHPPQYYHLNGNALFNLNDRAFRSFYVKHYRPWALAAAAVHERSFDTDFWRFLHNLDTINVVKGVYHRFAYTDVVQNWWRSSYSLSKIKAEQPNTYLVHGGYQKP